MPSQSNTPLSHPSLSHSSQDSGQKSLIKEPSVPHANEHPKVATAAAHPNGATESSSSAQSDGHVSHVSGHRTDKSP